MRTNDPSVLLAIKIFAYLSIVVVYIILGVSSKRKKTLANYMRIPYNFNQLSSNEFRNFNNVQGDFFYLTAIIVFGFLVIDYSLYKEKFSGILYLISIIISSFILVLGMIIWDKRTRKQ